VVRLGRAVDATQAAKALFFLTRITGTFPHPVRFLAALSPLEVIYTLGRAALVDWLTVVVAALSAIAVFRFQINSAGLVIAGGVIGLIAYAIGFVS
jgi:chromate transport protein ChrA